MKRLFAFVLAMLLLFALASCKVEQAKNPNSTSQDNEVEVVEEKSGSEIDKNLLVPYENDDGKWGYCTLDCEPVIEPQFDDAWGFSENGLAPVEVDDKWGYINEKGEMIRPKE